MEGFEASVEIDRPLASDIVGDFDVAYLAALEIFGNNIVGVDIAKTRLVPSCICSEGLHTALHVASRQRHSARRDNGARRRP